MPSAAFTLVLHSHLPWVLHHGRWPHGTDWLCEAAAESYLPLWRVLERRAERNPPRIALGLTPILCEQLAHPDFAAELREWLGARLDAARTDRDAFARARETALAALAARWEAFYRHTLEDFMGPHGCDLVARFRRLEERGVIEIVSCAATHAYLPLLASDAHLNAQLAVGRATHRRHFGREPSSLWLPECAYRPSGPWPTPAMRAAGLEQPGRVRAGLETWLDAHDVRATFVDAHLVAGGSPIEVSSADSDPRRRVVRNRGRVSQEAGPYRAARVDGARVAVFARDPRTALQVWSGEVGYPGDPEYLEFHKRRFPGGLRYWSVTDPRADLGTKRLYRPEAAAARVDEHARHFVGLLESTAAVARSAGVERPEICAMFDTELFGHWWSEGPRFLAAVLDRLSGHPSIETVPPAAELAAHPPRPRVALPEGSWGEAGSHHMWLNPDTRWVWPLIHGAERRFEALAGEARDAVSDPLLERLMRQAGRELLLLASSDWPFLITTLAARGYASGRVREHAAAFDRLAELAARRTRGGPISGGEERDLAACETREGPFPDLDWRAFASGPSVTIAGGGASKTGRPTASLGMEGP